MTRTARLPSAKFAAALVVLAPIPAQESTSDAAAQDKTRLAQQQAEITGLIARLEGIDPDQRRTAQARLCEIGAPAVPAIVAMATRSRRNPLLFSSVLRVLGSLGENASDAAPFLADELRRAPQNHRILETLASIGDAGFAILARVDQATQDNLMVRQYLIKSARTSDRALVYVFRQSIQPRGNYPAQLTGLRERRTCAAAARAWLALVTELRGTARVTAARELAALPPAAFEPAMDARLLAHLDHSAGDSHEAEVRVAIARAMGSVAERRPTAWQAVLDKAEDPRRVWAPVAFGFAGTAGISPLIKLLGDADDTVRWRTIQGLHRIGAAAIEPLIRAAKAGSGTDGGDEADRRRAGAKAALARLQRMAKETR